MFCSEEVVKTGSGFQVPKKVLEHPEIYDDTEVETNPSVNGLPAEHQLTSI